jgi:membrane protease YdiL (CAAX protease family)
MTFLLAARQGRASVAAHAFGVLLVAALYVVASLVAAAMLFGASGTPADPDTIPELPLGSIGAAATLAILLLPSVAVLLGVVVVVPVVHGRSPMTLVRAVGLPRWRRALVAGVVWAGAAAAYEAVSVFLYRGSYTWTFDAARFVPLLVVAVLLIPLQSAAEELFFRGYLMQWLGSMFGRGWVALLISSALFAAVHLGNPELARFGRGFLFYYAGVGVAFGLATLLDDGLEVAIGAHTANNLWGALVVSFPGSVLDTPALLRMEGVPPEVMVTLGGATALTALVVLAILFDWRERWSALGRIEPRGDASASLP